MLKCDFHIHSMEDPKDMLAHDAVDLVDHAVQLGYHAIALTLHGRLYAPTELIHYAQSKGLLLIPGIEAYVDRKEVLILGLTPEDLKRVRTFHDLRALKKERRDDLLIIAPHPYYHLPQCLGEQLERNIDLFDAIEWCHFYTSWWNPNVTAKKISTKHGIPLIACSDTHQLRWMKHHYALVDAPPVRKDLFEAIRKGKLKNVSRPMNWSELFQRTAWGMVYHDLRTKGRKLGLFSPRQPKPIPRTIQTPEHSLKHPLMTEK